MVDPHSDRAGNPQDPDGTAGLTRRERRAAAEQVGGSSGGAIPEAASAGGEASARPDAAKTLDDLFVSAASGSEAASQRPRKRRGAGCIVALVLLLAIGGTAAGVAWWAWSNYETPIRELMGWQEPKDFEAGQAHGEAMVTISEGDTGEAISASLYEAGVTKTPEAFYDLLVDRDLSPTFYPGVYRLQLEMTSAAALEALENPENKIDHSALVREGLTVQATLGILAESLEIPLEEFEAAADPAALGVNATSLEGWLFPAMYEFDPGVTATQVLQTMVDRTKQSLADAGVPDDQQQRVLTIASIIQREARLESDFYQVSRVIQNRLDAGMLLQMDSTAQYGVGQIHDGTVSSSGEALTDDNPWNTYVHAGLPAGPIANPGDLAIDAAMHPADGPWLFFVTWNLDTGETIFTETDAEHEEAKQRWFQWCDENPDSGC